MLRVSLWKKILLLVLLVTPIFYIEYTGNVLDEIEFTTSSQCTISLPSRALDIPLPVKNNMYLSGKMRNYLKENPDNLMASELTTLVSDYVDIDNSLSNSKKKPESLRVTYLNAERGKFWCELAHLIKKDMSIGGTDVWIINEFDLGMARSDNLYTLRLFAYSLGLNYAFGIEFLELTHGNWDEIKKIEKVHGQDEWGLHGNAVLSVFPIKSAKIVRSGGIEYLYNRSSSFFNAQGAEMRLGSRMTLFAQIETPNGKLLSVAASHQQAGMEDTKYDSHKHSVVSLLKNYISQLNMPVIFGGDLWPDLCRNLNLMEFINVKTPMVRKKPDGSVKFGGGGGDYICSSNHAVDTVSAATIVPGISSPNDAGKREVYMDHQMISFSFNLIQK